MRVVDLLEVPVSIFGTADYNDQVCLAWRR